MELSVPDKFKLELPFPIEIDSDPSAIMAKFVKRTSVRVTA